MAMGPKVAAILALLAAGNVQIEGKRSGAAKLVPRPLVSLGVHTRRWLNLGNLFGTPTKSATPYDRILGNPVFQVTTPWGSTYMSMERNSDTQSSAAPSFDNIFTVGSKPKSAADSQSDSKPIAVFYTDPEDALSVHAELMQLDQMKQDPNTDIRITSSSLGKAIRQASNIHDQGLLTGNPLDPLTGKVKPVSEGVLRYKIMPSQRQLYYAARCYGRERVGLGFMDGQTASNDAINAVLGTSTLGTNNMIRRQKKANPATRKDDKEKSSVRTPMQIRNAHMDGYTGIPVFYAPYLHRKVHPVRRLLTGKAHKYEIPLFFNYEDLEVAWRKAAKGDAPNSLPPNVEVFNLWDVLTSMDKQRYRTQQKLIGSWRTDPVNVAKNVLLSPFVSRVQTLSSDNTALDLNDVTFVPSSRCINYKEQLSARGNGKARLRPMR